MFGNMDESEFGQFVAALWEQQGWQTQVKHDDGRVFVAVQRPETNEEGLLWAVADGEVGGQQVQQFQSMCQQHEIGEAAIVTAGTLSDHAQKVANGTGVELLDSEGIAKILEHKGLTDLPKQYVGGGGSGGGGGGSGGRSGSGDGGGSGGGGGSGDIQEKVRNVASELAETVRDRTKAIEERTPELPYGIPVVAVVAVVVVVALLSAGVLLGPSIPFLGGGDGISAAATSPEGANSSLRVTWNAEVTDTFDPDESDDLAYPAPEGKQFVVVVMNVQNTGEGTVPLEQSAFHFRANGTTYQKETLADHDNSLSVPLGAGNELPIWTVFMIPEGESGTLVYEQNATDVSVAVEFERDSGMSMNVTQL